MQHAMGAGVAGSRTPNPNPAATKVRNLASHVIYGLGTTSPRSR